MLSMRKLASHWLCLCCGPPAATSCYSPGAAVSQLSRHWLSVQLAHTVKRLHDNKDAPYILVLCSYLGLTLICKKHMLCMSIFWDTVVLNWNLIWVYFSTCNLWTEHMHHLQSQIYQKITFLQHLSSHNIPFYRIKCVGLFFHSSMLNVNC